MKSHLISLIAPLWLLLGAACLGEPVVEYLEPVSVARGKQGRLALVGTGIDRALGLWTSLPAGKIKVGAILKSEPQRTELDLDVAADCPAGIYGLRLATEDGLSNLQLFVVDDLVPQPQLADPQKDFPVAVSGAFRSAALDRYKIEVSAGQRLSFDVVSSRLGTDADPLVTIYDSIGRRVVQRDNDPGLFFDCCFEHTFVAGGVYSVELRDARFQGSPHWRYLLRIGSFPAARVAVPSSVRPGQTTELRFPELGNESIRFDVPADLPAGGFFYTLRRPSDNPSTWIPLLCTSAASAMEIEPNEMPEQATLADGIPIWLNGVLGSPADKDYFTLVLQAGQKISLRAETRPLNSAADVQLTLFDPGGGEVQRVDDVSLPGGAPDEAAFTFTAGKEGKHNLLVQEMSGSGGPEFTYRVEVQPLVPKIQLVAEFSSLTVPQDSYQMIPLTVTRSDYNGPIELSVIDGPPGLTLEPSLIPAGENYLLCKLRVPASVPAGIYTLGFAGKSKVGENVVTTLATMQPLVDRQVINVDLQKHALRDNQRWLPPSVTRCLALQVTPPAPFGVDLAETSWVLPRYQQVGLPLAITRLAGFEEPITFSGAGGQVGEESQGRRQVFGRFPVAQKDQPTITATFHSRSQANEAKDRVDLLAVGKQGSRTVTLVRCFTLDVRPAFEISLEPAQVMLAPGEKSRVKLVSKRLPSFAGDIVVSPSTASGVTLPPMITIPAGQSEVEVDLTVAPGAQPRRERIRFLAVATVDGFQEELRPVELDLEIKAPATTK